MAFVRFKGYGVNGGEVYVNTDRVMTFHQIDFNGNYGSEIIMDDGSRVRVDAWPSDVEKALEGK